MSASGGVSTALAAVYDRAAPARTRRTLAINAARRQFPAPSASAAVPGAKERRSSPTAGGPGGP
ncbi:MAG TPA: hypothetical protein PLU22_11740, partial [Polyangiaceae bacterium]|nr:hypothetical protein [Polyangiaceae bacterium]